MSSDIKRYFEILEQLVADEYRLEEQADKQFLTRVKWLRYAETFCITCLTIGLILWVFVWLKMSWLKDIASFFLILALFSFVMTLLGVYRTKSSALTVAKYCAEADDKYLSLLVSLPIHTLELGCLEIEHCRNWFIKGFASLAGVIDKVGLIPSILSIAALYAIPDKLPEWATPLVVMCIMLYIVVSLLQKRLIRLERMVSLTKLALKLKEKNKME